MNADAIQREVASLRTSASALRETGRRHAEGAETIGSAIGALPSAWVSGASRRTVASAQEAVDRVEPVAASLLEAAGVVDGLAEEGGTVAERLRAHERAHEDARRRLVTVSTSLGNDPDAVQQRQRAEGDLSNARAGEAREQQAWEAACRTADTKLRPHAEAVRLAAREPSFTDTLAYRGLLRSRVLTRSVDIAYGAGLVASAWTRRAVLRTGRVVQGTAAALGAVGGQLRDALVRRATLARRPGLIAALGRGVRGAVRAVPAAIGTARAAVGAWRDVGRSYAPRIAHETQRLERGSDLVRHGSRVSRVLRGPLAVLSVPADVTVLARGSSYEGARGTVDRAMAGVGLAGTVALGAGAVAVGVGAVAAAPVLLTGAAIAGGAAAAWGLGNLAWDASAGLRDRAGRKVSQAASDAKQLASSAASTVADVGSGIVASASGGLSRLGSVFSRG